MMMLKWAGFGLWVDVIFKSLFAVGFQVTQKVGVGGTKLSNLYQTDSDVS